MAVIDRMDHRQALSVVAVSVGPQLVLNLVAFKIGQAAHFQNPVFRHGGGPHQIAPSGIIIDVPEQSPHIDHRATHDGQGYLVRYIVLVGATEVGFHGVAQRVKGP